MKKSTIFFFLCLAFTLGVAAHSLLVPGRRVADPFSLYVAALASGGAGLLVWRRRKMAVACLGLALFILGAFRYNQTITEASAYHIAQRIGEEVTVRGLVDGLPRRREKTAAYVVKLECPVKGAECGKLLLTTPLLPEYKYGDALSITCKAQPLGEYERWAIREGVGVSCAFPEHVAVVSEGKGLRVKAVLFKVRALFHEKLTRLFPDPHGGLLAGILYGDTGSMSRALKETFRTTGLAHITALSGYNISIISVVLLSALVYVGLTRRQALPLAVIMILGFVVATGAEASVVRAAIMGLLAAGAKGIGRLLRPRNALALAGAAMLAVNPRLLRFDLGFLLSFAATVALVWFASDIEARTLVRKLPKLFEIRGTAAASVSALLFTTPILLYYTGIFGPFSLIANVLVVPIVPAAMTLGFFAVAADFLWHPLGIGLSFIARVTLEYIVRIAEWLARFGALHIRISFLTALTLFCVVVWCMWLWKKRGSTQIRHKATFHP